MVKSKVLTLSQTNSSNIHFTLPTTLDTVDIASDLLLVYTQCMCQILHLNRVVYSNTQLVTDMWKLC